MEADEVEESTVVDSKVTHPTGRRSPWFITTVVAIGVATDCFCYMCIVPVVPFRLAELGYTDVSAKTSWLLFAFGAGQVISTFPVTYVFHRYPYRRGPLVIGVVTITGALVLFMLVEAYWAMFVSRLVQGFCATVIWSVGFALLCETCDSATIGRQMGFAMSGMSIGTITAPPIGGALYAALGWNGPFLLCIGFCVLDLVLRLAVSDSPGLPERKGSDDEFPESDHEEVTKVKADPTDLSPWDIIKTVMTSSRGLAAMSLTSLFGLVTGALEPTLVALFPSFGHRLIIPCLTPRLQAVWGKDAAFVGLVYLIGCTPGCLAGPITGAIADHFGAQAVAGPSIILVLPFTLLLLSKQSLPAFIAFFAAIDFFLNCTMSPTGVEITKIAEETEGLGEIHQFGALNVAFAVSSAIGAAAGGLLYDRTIAGWDAVCWFCFACCVVTLPGVLLKTGDQPLLSRRIRLNEE